MKHKWWCKYLGFLRGQAPARSKKVSQEPPYDMTTYLFECPRCRANETRKVYERKKKASQ